MAEMVNHTALLTGSSQRSVYVWVQELRSDDGFLIAVVGERPQNTAGRKLLYLGRFREERGRDGEKRGRERWREEKG